MGNINIECEDDDYYDHCQIEISPRTNYGKGWNVLTQEEVEEDRCKSYSYIF